MRIRQIALLAATIVASIQLQAASYYGPTAKNDHLYRIALANKPSKQVTVGQTMVTIFQHNPEAFANHNMNNLLVGSLLVMPTAREVAEVDAKLASAIIANHNAHKSPTPIAPVVKIDNNHDPYISQSDSIVAAMDAVPLPRTELGKEVTMLTQDNNSVQVSENDLQDFIVNKIESAINERVRVIGEQHQTVPSIATQNTTQIEQTINPAEIHGSSVPAIGIDAPTEIEDSAHLIQLRAHLNELQVQLTSIIHILEDNAEIFTVKDTLENKFSDTGGYVVSHYLSKLYNLSPTEVKNPYVEIGLALSIALLLLGLVIESRATIPVHARNQEDPLYDLEEDEYNYMASEEGIPAKLNLARAYCDMGLPDKARKVLTEITARGDAQQREQARNLLMDMDK